MEFKKVHAYELLPLGAAAGDMIRDCSGKISTLANKPVRYTICGSEMIAFPCVSSRPVIVWHHDEVEYAPKPAPSKPVAAISAEEREILKKARDVTLRHFDPACVESFEETVWKICFSALSAAITQPTDK